MAPKRDPERSRCLVDRAVEMQDLKRFCNDYGLKYIKTQARILGWFNSQPTEVKLRVLDLTRAAQPIEQPQPVAA